MKELRRNILVGIGIGIILSVINLLYFYFAGNNVISVPKVKMMIAYCLIYSVVLTIVNSTFFSYMSNVEMETKNLKYRFTINIVGSISLTLLAVFILRLIENVLIKGKEFGQFVQEEDYLFYFSCMVISMIISFIFYSAYFYKESQKKKVTEQKVIAGTASAKFNALKNQLDPHFLFNSLNVLSSLIDENPENAQNFTTGLSKVYRYVLEQKDKDLVTVDEELNFARTYMSLIKMRFEDSIIFDLPDNALDPDSKVVPLSLQLLLENAVKHNVVTSARPLKIRIYERDSELIVENNFQEKRNFQKSSGVGLSNIRQRYDLLTSKKVKINQSAESFAVSLPMLTKHVTVMQSKQKTSLDTGYLNARRRVEELKEFYYNLISYVLVIPFLIFIWWWTSPNGYQWFWFPMLGWGIGLGFHAYKVFVNDGILGGEWEKRKIEQFMKEDN